jgi:hypothetical protein
MKRLSLPALLLSAAALFLAVAASGCDLFGSGPKAFTWVEPGARMVYDYRSAGEPYVEPRNGFVYDDTDSAFSFRYVDPEYDEKKFRVRYLSWDFGGSNGVALPLLSGFYGVPAPYRAEDGLRLEYPESCEDADSYDDAVLVPADPEKGERYYHYRCGDEVEREYRVTAVEQTVTVPAGTFSGVFVLKSKNPRPQLTRSGPEKQYWSEKEGLIQIEKFYKDGGKVGTYVLASKNF